MLTKLFRDFNRHYVKCQGVARKLGEFSFKLKNDGEKVIASYHTPNNKETMRFVVLMRRFLDPASNLHYEKVWSTIIRDFPHEIPQELIESFESRSNQLSKGRVSISIDGKNFTAEDIYKTLSSGGYFENQENVHEQLIEISKTPFASPLFWFQFYSYTVEAFELLKFLSLAISTIQKSNKFKAIYGEKTTVEPKCIYCLGTKGNFTSEEHIFPEALGNDELVLPKGYVCDRCNNGILSQLDTALIRFEPISFLQTQLVPFTKDGSLPKANFQNMTMERTSPNHIHIVPKDKSGEIKNKKSLGNGWYSYSLEMRGKPVTQKSIKLLGRALLKIALGIVALSQGREYACSAKFETARKFILGKGNFNNNFFIKLNNKPHIGGKAEYKESQDGTIVAIDIMGLLFLLNLEEKTLLNFNQEIRPEDFGLYSLHD